MGKSKKEKGNLYKNENSHEVDETSKVKESKKSATKEPYLTWKKIGQRLFCVLFLLAAVYWTSLDNDEITLKSNEHYKRYAKKVPCSADYNKESHSQACIPKRCGRIITDDLVTEDEASHLLSVAKKGLALGGSHGGASILDLHSGALSKGKAFVNIYKLDANKNIFSQEDFNVYRTVKNKIHKMICSEFGVLPNFLYLTHPTFFSKITSKPAQTKHDEYWHPHIDKETYPSFHYTSLLYLSTYAQNFSGGKFVFVDEKKNMTVEPHLGRVSMFTSGSENVHHVQKVSSGERYALTVSFTCDKNFAIEDPG